MALNSGSFRPCHSPTNNRSSAKPRELITSSEHERRDVLTVQCGLIRPDKRLKAYVQTRPQQIVWIRKLYGNLGPPRGWQDARQATDQRSRRKAHPGAITNR